MKMKGFMFLTDWYQVDEKYYDEWSSIQYDQNNHNLDVPVIKYGSLRIFNENIRENKNHELGLINSLHK